MVSQEKEIHIDMFVPYCQNVLKNVHAKLEIPTEVIN